MGTDLRSATVIRAVHELGDRTNGWPTAERIADYLRAPTGDVLALLRDLKAARIVTDRRRKGQRVWMPWSEA
jgi:hypothetical protein